MKTTTVATRSLSTLLERGQGMVEYGLILGVVSLAGLAGLITLGPKILVAFQTATTAFGA
jgi:Flp pilus assembly pilin Flp